MDAITEVLTEAIRSPVMPLIVLAVCVIDGFFPPVPSETTVVAAAAFALTSDVEAGTFVAILAAATIGAAGGDSVAYGIGRRIGSERFLWMRRPRVRRAIAWSARQLHRRPTTLILTGRYIPIGRVAVNMTAGATRLPYRRFAPVSVLAAASWVCFCFGIAMLASTWFSEAPIAAALAAVVTAMVLGLTLDGIVRACGRNRRQTPEPDAAPPA